MPNLDYANAVRIQINTLYTVPSDGIIFVSDANAGGALTITINDKLIDTMNYSSGLFSFNQQYPVRTGDRFLSNRTNSTFVPLRN